MNNDLLPSLLEKTLFLAQQSQIAGIVWFLPSLLMAYLGGLLAGFSPCNYPLLPVTLHLLGCQRSQAFAYFFGMTFTYACLGLLTAWSGTLLGSWLEHPSLLLTLGVLMLGLAMKSQKGVVFFGGLPFFQKMFFSQTHQPLFLLFRATLLGISSGILASPCTTPILSTLLAYNTLRQHSLVSGFFFMLAFSAGLGSPLLILAGSSIFLKGLLPQQGSWMKLLQAMNLLLLVFLGVWLIVSGIRRL